MHDTPMKPTNPGEVVRYSVAHVTERTLTGHFVTCKAATLEHAEGAMVAYDDYAKLEAENRFLKMEVERLKNNVAYLDRKLDDELDNK